MSMKDQYDDGRYDSVESNSGRTDRMANSGVIESPGGWCVPESQKPGWPFDRYNPAFSIAPIPELHPKYGLPITARRGGIQYPKKGITVTTNAQREAELKAINDLRDEMNARAAKLRKEIRQNNIPPEPDSEGYGDAFAVDVKFTSSGKYYRFLLLRTPNGWYTTGLHKENNLFLNWDALMQWLRGPDVYSHSGIVVLNQGPIVVDGTL